MGEFEVRGENTLKFLQSIMVNDVSKLEKKQAQYNIICYEHGGVVDDLFIYNLEDKYFIVVNAGNIKKDFAGIK